MAARRSEKKEQARPAPQMTIGALFPVGVSLGRNTAFPSPASLRRPSAQTASNKK